jgi:hypothetical protein
MPHCRCKVASTFFGEDGSTKYCTCLQDQFPPPGVELDSGTAFLSAEPGLIFSSLTSRCRSGLIP